MARLWKTLTMANEAYKDLNEQAAEFHRAEFAPRKIFDLEIDLGLFSHDVNITNKTEDALANTVVSVVLVKEDGGKTEETERYLTWPPGATKTIKVSASGTFRKKFTIRLEGTTDYAPPGSKRRTVPIVQSWHWTPK